MQKWSNCKRNQQQNVLTSTTYKYIPSPNYKIKEQKDSETG